MNLDFSLSAAKLATLSKPSGIHISAKPGTNKSSYQHMLVNTLY